MTSYQSLEGAALGVNPTDCRDDAIASYSPIVISLDYEFYDFVGAHRVDITSEMLRPTDELMRVCEAHGAVLTIMFEMGGFFLLRQQAPRLASRIECQLQEALARGHDVQLHLHPHLLPESGAKYNERRKSVWFRDYRPVHQVLARDPQLFAHCKRVAEELLKPVVADYEMIAFRAGKYQVQPHAKIYAALAEAGFLAASNVVQGRYLANYGGHLGHDYRTAWTGCSPYFPSDANIGWPSRAEARTLLELPVCVSDSTSWSFDALPGKALVEIFRRHHAKRVPLIMLGHSKGRTVNKLRALDEVLAFIGAADDAVFCRLSDTVRDWLPRAEQSLASTWDEAIEAHFVTAAENRERLSRLERTRLTSVVAAVRAAAALRGGTCRVAILGCGTGYSLLLPLAEELKGDARARLYGYDNDPQSVAFCSSIVDRRKLVNVDFGLPSEATCDLIVVQDLDTDTDLSRLHAELARSCLKQGGRKITFSAGPSKWSQARGMLTELRQQIGYRLPPLARCANRVRRIYAARRIGAANPQKHITMLRALRTDDMPPCAPTT
jgi:hypothetical protein